jgi:hypothetical protein
MALDINSANLLGICVARGTDSSRRCFHLLFCYGTQLDSYSSLADFYEKRRRGFYERFRVRTVSPFCPTCVGVVVRIVLQLLL